MNSDGEIGFISLYEDSLCITGWCWNNWRILQGFSWREISQKLILLWEFHHYHFPLWLMRNACETTCCSREILFLNFFIKASKTKSLDCWLFCLFLVLLRNLWWPEPGLRARLVLELSEGLSILKLICSSQPWMTKLFWDVRSNCSLPLPWIFNNISKALWCTSPLQNTGVAEWILQTSLSSCVGIPAVVSAMVVKDASCSGVQ